MSFHPPMFLVVEPESNEIRWYLADDEAHPWRGFHSAQQGVPGRLRAPLLNGELFSLWARLVDDSEIRIESFEYKIENGNTVKFSRSGSKLVSEVSDHEGRAIEIQACTEPGRPGTCQNDGIPPDVLGKVDSQGIRVVAQNGDSKNHKAAKWVFLKPGEV